MIISEGVGIFSRSICNDREIGAPAYQANSSSRIYVVCQACDDGYGDYAFACKLGNFLGKINSHFQVILSGIDAPTHQKLSNFAATRRLYCTLANKSIDFRKLLPCEMQNTLIVHGPFLKDPLSLPPDFPQKNVWHIAEYSNESVVHESIPQTYTSGLGPNEWGVFGRGGKSEQNIRRRLFCNPFLASYVSTDSEHPCYFAYCYDYRTVLAFIRIILSAHDESDEFATVTLCLPGDRKKIGFQQLLQEIPTILANESNAPICLECIWPHPKTVDLEPERALSPFRPVPHKRKAGDHIPMYSVLEQCSALRWEFPSNRNRYKLQILFPGFLSQEDMQKLSIQSKCSCITGDQTFSDHLGKPIVYECRPHKNKFFMNTIEIVKQYNLQKLAKFWEATHPFMSGSADFKVHGRIDPETIRSIKLLDDPDLQQEFKNFGKIVKSTHNLISKIAREFQKWKYERNLEISEDLSRCI